MIATKAPPRLAPMARRVPPWWWPALLAGAAVQTWFRPGRFIAIGDVAPFRRAGFAEEYLWFWNHTTTGAGSTSSAIARAIEVWTIEVVGWFGGSPMLAQRLFTTVIVVAAIGAVGWCAAAFTSRPSAIVLAGVVAFSNPFWISRLPNPLVLVALGYAAWVLGVVVRVARGHRVSPVACALGTLGLSYLALNVALLVVIVLWGAVVIAGASLVVGPGGTGAALRFSGRVAPLALLVNLWWIGPLVWSLVAPAGFEISAQLEVTSWSWTHVDNSMPNVAALTAHWAWSHPEFIPVAQTLDRFPFIVLRWVLPATVVASVVLASGPRRRAAWALGGCAAALIAVSKGLHPPFAAANRFLYDVVPGSSLLREPLSKLGPILVVVYAVLVALLVAELADRWDRRRAGTGTDGGSDGRARLVVRAGAGLVVASMVVAAFPMWTGGWVPTDQPVFPSARVAVPTWWDEAAAVIDAEAGDGKLLTLPVNDYYQVPTIWGYYGVDVVPYLVRRPVLQQLPGGYYTDRAELAALLGATERAVLHHDRGAVAPLLDSLGASLVLVRGDLDLAMLPGRSLAAPEALDAGLMVADGIELIGAFGPMRLYRRSAPAAPVVRFERAVDVQASPDGLAAVTASLRPDVGVLSDPAAADAARQLGIEVEPAAVVDRPQVGALGISVRSGAGAVLRPQADRVIEATVAQGAVVIREAWRVRSAAEGPEIARLTTGEAIVGGLAVDGRGIPVVDGVALSRAGIDAPVSALVQDDEQPRVGRPGPAGNCAGPAEGPGVRRSSPIAGGIRLTSTGGLACVTWTAEVAVRTGWVRVDLEHRAVQGAPPRICVQALPGLACLPATALEPGDGWVRSAVVVEVPAGASEVAVVAYAEAPDPSLGPAEAIVEYRNVEITHLRETLPVTLAPVAPVVEVVPGPVIVDGPVSGNVLGPFGPLGDCDRSDGRSSVEVGLATEDLRGGIELAAAGHSACRAASIGSLGAASTFDVQLRYEVVEGAERPRLCVFDPAADRCLVLRSNDGTPGEPGLELSGSPGSHRIDARVDVPASASALSLYLYADGPSAGRQGTSRIRYTEVRVVPIAPFAVVVAPERHLAGRPPVPAPIIPSAWSNPARVTAIVPPGRPSVVAIHQSAASGWRSSIDGRPVTVHGHRAGWLLPGDGEERSITATYQPAVLLRWLAWASLLVVAASAGLLGGQAWMRRRGLPAPADPAAPPGAPRGPRATP
jgi:arabinofuranan 3-O-arabinosyltransferase